MDGRREKWRCMCDCGNESTPTTDNLVRAKGTVARSCGCLRSEIMKETHTIHGCCSRLDGRLPEYQVWNTMIQRCYNPNSSSYHDYGARGITVCQEWRDSFAVFIADMGRRPSAKHSIERIDNSGPYCKANCKWATRIEQGSNKRNNRWIEFRGETKTLAQWSRSIGIGTANLNWRLRVGWPLERALTEPPRKITYIAP